MSLPSSSIQNTNVPPSPISIDECFPEGPKPGHFPLVYFGREDCKHCSKNKFSPIVLYVKFYFRSGFVFFSFFFLGRWRAEIQNAAKGHAAYRILGVIGPNPSAGRKDWPKFHSSLLGRIAIFQINFFAPTAGQLPKGPLLQVFFLRQS